MDRYEARKAISKRFRGTRLLVKVKDHTHNVGTHDRCKTTSRTNDYKTMVC